MGKQELVYDMLLILWMLFSVTIPVVNADIFVDLNAVTTDSNLTVLCVETMRIYGVGVDLVTYCSNPANQEVMYYTERVAVQLDSHIVWADYVLYKGVTARGIVQSYPTQLNTELANQNFSTGYVSVVTDVGKNLGIVLGCSLGYILWCILIVLFFCWKGAL
jgi:hypothetical protein